MSHLHAQTHRHTQAAERYVNAHLQGCADAGGSKLPLTAQQLVALSQCVHVGFCCCSCRGGGRRGGMRLGSIVQRRVPLGRQFVHVFLGLDSHPPKVRDARNHIGNCSRGGGHKTESDAIMTASPSHSPQTHPVHVGVGNHVCLFTGAWDACFVWGFQTKDVRSSGTGSHVPPVPQQPRPPTPVQPAPLRPALARPRSPPAHIMRPTQS
jgi:hypothetical protein